MRNFIQVYVDACRSFKNKVYYKNILETAGFAIFT